MAQVDLSELATRAEGERITQGLSYRKLAVVTGIAFSTLARVLKRREGDFDRETERKLRLWLGEPVTHITPLDLRNQAHELGRIMAQSCAAEIETIVTKIISDAQTCINRPTDA